MRIVSGSGASDTVLAILSQPLVVEVRDPTGQPRAGIVVRFEAQPIEATAREPSVDVRRISTDAFKASMAASTDSSGRAAVQVQLGRRAGSGSIAITAPELGFQDMAQYTIKPGALTTLKLAPADTLTYTERSYPLRVYLSDRWGNTRADSIRFSAGPGVSVSADGRVTAQSVGRTFIAAEAAGVVDTARLSIPPQGTIAGISGPLYQESVVVLNLDGSDLRKVAPLKTYSQRTAPHWSPSGSELVFHNWLNEIHAYVTDVSGNVRRLISAGGPGNEVYPRYSRDGEWVFFSGGEDVRSLSIWRVRANGSSPQRIGPPGTLSRSDTDPSPSPDGTRVAFVAVQPGPNWNVRILHVASGRVDSPAISGVAPRWSPKEDVIAFIDVAGRVQVMSPDGAAIRTVSALGRLYAAGLDWSPDGRWLIAQQRANARFDLIEVATGTTIPLPFSIPLEQPAWKP